MLVWHLLRFLVYEFLVLLLLTISLSKGNGEICLLCCKIQTPVENLNCSWKSLSDKEHNLYVQPLKITWKSLSDEAHTLDLQPLNKTLSPFPLNLTAPAGQNWLIIPRGSLTKSYHYNLRLVAVDNEVSMNIKFDYNGENVLLDPPAITKIVSEAPGNVQLHWSDSRHASSEQNVMLRYRLVGQSNWTEINSTLLEPTSCELDTLVPYLEYEVQIRYLENIAHNRIGSKWSDLVSFCNPENERRDHFGKIGVPCGRLDVWGRPTEGPSLFIQWKQLNIHTHRGEILGYNVTYNHGGTVHSEEVKSCHVLLPANSTDICVSARNIHGQGYPSCATHICKDLIRNAGIKVLPDVAENIIVSWEETLSYPAHPHAYLAEWKEQAKTGDDTLNWSRFQTANQRFALPGKFAPYVAYQVSVFAIYHNDCAGLVSTTIYSQEGAPSTGPNFSIHLLSFTEALIVWEEIPVQYRRGFITNYTICLNRTEYIQRQTVLTATNYLFSGLLPNTAYTMWMTASTKAGEGPAGDIKTFQTGSASFSYALICAPIGFILLVGLGLVMCSQSVIRDVCWPNIPNLDISSAVMNSPQYNSMWDVDQVKYPPSAHLS